MPSNASRRDVIVADNDYIVRNILRSVLETAGFTVWQAADGEEAISCAMRTRARLIILDYRMPKLDGFAACVRIRALPDYSAVPILMLTAFDDVRTRAAAERAGATMFLAKPFKPVDLMSVIGVLLGTAGPDGKVTSEARTLIWKHRREPVPLFGEPTELSEGRRILNIHRR